MDESKKLELERLLNSLTKEDLRDMFLEKSIEAGELIRQAEKNQPLVEFAQAAFSTDDLIEFSAVAKILNFKGMGRNNTLEFLRDKAVLRPKSKYSNNEPYQKYVDRGYFKIVEQIFDIDGYGTQINRKPVVTQSGLDFIRKLLLEAGYEYNNKQN